MSKKILELIPEVLREDLINEVKDVLREKGYDIKDPNGGKDNASEKDIDAAINEWANKGKQQ